MYFWNLKELKQKLIAGEVSESQVFKYFWAVLVLDTSLISIWGLVEVSEDLGLWDWIDAGGSFLTVILGTIFLYYRNGGNAGEKFFTRYLPLLGVLGIRFLVFCAPLIALWGIYIWQYEDSSEAGTWYEVTVGSMIFILFYWRLAKHISDVAQPGGA